jgi:protoporphyrinogen/coproporphyrinogen III oxidase
MKPITVVGAGFSGLTLAYYLKELGLEVEIFERHSQAGGLISTERSELGLAERAANALLADREIEELFHKLDVPFATQLPQRKRRYIFWRRPRRWPVSLATTLKLLKVATRTAIGHKANVVPIPGETVHEWCQRIMNAEFEEHLLAPALQGVYAGDTKQLSATLTLLPMFLNSTPRGKLKGSVAPERGMGQLIDALTKKLRDQGVPIHYGREFALGPELKNPVVLCTSAWVAAELVANHDTQLARHLKGCQSLPLITVTCFFAPEAGDLEGFGCLFPHAQDFQAAGVLFNNCIFAGRSDLRSETWIFGGAQNAEILNKSDDQLTEALLGDRQRLTTSTQRPVRVRITRWPRALPYYTTEWEQTLAELNVKPPLFLHGNYLGTIGLAKIHQRSKRLARSLKDQYGH